MYVGMIYIYPHAVLIFYDKIGFESSLNPEINQHQSEI